MVSPFSACFLKPYLYTMSYFLKPYGQGCSMIRDVLTQGKKATAYPAMCDRLSDQSEVENRVVVDGNLITSRGPGTSIEFALAIVEKLFGRQLALELAKAVVFARP
ncbi:Protein DJ-1-like protein [Vigna angularis]|uniref:Protein DJ-1-like protein n=1 Tax=Phaseolus angularis TaxID=3914 RepID=A0A8T0JIR9_PHAAN|nr:Protein DJ-1-like protein [Vigna angularis]